MNQASHNLNDTVFISMTEHSILSVKGPDAEKFLQGQCTCDLRETENNHIIMGAHCNAKGRALSSFNLIKASEDEYLLRMRKCNLKNTLEALNKYSVFSKVTLSESALQATAILHELDSPPPYELPDLRHHWKNDEGQIVLNHENRFIEIWATPEDTQKLSADLKNTYKLGTKELLDHHLINCGLVDIQAQTSGEFIPQDLNYHLVGAISFSKGCYTGQEIVARMQYRAKLKKHTYRATIHTLDKVEVGSQIIFENSQDKPVGVVVASSLLPTGNTRETAVSALITTMEDTFNSSSTLIEIKSKAKISWLSLPYAIT